MLWESSYWGIQRLHIVMRVVSGTQANCRRAGPFTMNSPSTRANSNEFTHADPLLLLGGQGPWSSGKPTLQH